MLRYMLIIVCVASLNNDQDARNNLINISIKMTLSQVAEGLRQAEILWDRISSEVSSGSSGGS